MWLDLENADYIRERLGFAGCRIALRVDHDVIAADGTTTLHDTRYFLSSCDPGSVTADQLLRTVRDHWQIENSLHFTKDRWWDEDRHWTRRPGLAEHLAVLNTAALSVLSTRCSPDKPLRAHADLHAWLPTRALQLLGLI